MYTFEITLTGGSKSDISYLKMPTYYKTNLWLSQKDFLKIPEIGIQVPNQATPAPPGILAQYLPILVFSKSGKAYQNREGEKSGKKIKDCKSVDLNIALFKVFIEVLCYFIFYANWFSSSTWLILKSRASLHFEEAWIWILGLLIAISLKLDYPLVCKVPHRYHETVPWWD